MVYGVNMDAVYALIFGLLAVMRVVMLDEWSVTARQM